MGRPVAHTPQTQVLTDGINWWLNKAALEQTWGIVHGQLPGALLKAKATRKMGATSNAAMRTVDPYNRFWGAEGSVCTCETPAHAKHESLVWGLLVWGCAQSSSPPLACSLIPQSMACQLTAWRKTVWDSAFRCSTQLLNTMLQSNEGEQCSN